MVVFFILLGVTWTNQGIYLAVIFYQLGKKISNFLPGW